MNFVSIALYFYVYISVIELNNSRSPIYNIYISLSLSIAPVGKYIVTFYVDISAVPAVM